MLGKLIKSSLQSVLGTKRIDSQQINTKVPPYNYMGNNTGSRVTSQEQMNPYQNYGMSNQVPPHLNPYINSDADWETFRQLTNNQEFLSNQLNQINYEHQRANQYAQLTEMIRNQRTEQQSQALHNGADSGYYDRINNAYLRGIQSMQNQNKKSK